MPPTSSEPEPQRQRPLVLQTESLDPAAAAWLRERCDVVECPWSGGKDAGRFAELLPETDGLLVRTYTVVDEALLARAMRLKVVARAGVGLDNIDQAACARRGVAVVSTPGANTRAVVELVTAFLLDILRPRVFLSEALSRGEWDSARKSLIAERQMSDLTLGIIGLGRVGSAIARVGAAMEMRVLYNDIIEIAPEKRAGAKPAPLENVLREAHVVTLHVDGRAENRGLIGAAQLAACKPDAVFVNTSRGFVIDAAALADFLRRSSSAHAVLDVHDPEPFGPGYPLLGLPNAHLSPHIGAATRTAHANMSWVVKDLWQVLKGRGEREEGRG